MATRSIDARERYTREDERELTFVGFLAFTDRPKEGAREAILELSRRGVDIKLITGDSRRVAEHVARQVGPGTTRVLTGAQIHQLSLLPGPALMPPSFTVPEGRPARARPARGRWLEQACQGQERGVCSCSGGALDGDGGPCRTGRSSRFHAVMPPSRLETCRKPWRNRIDGLGPMRPALSPPGWGLREGHVFTFGGRRTTRRFIRAGAAPRLAGSHRPPGR